MGRDSSVCIVTVYGLDGPGIEPWWDEIFRTLPERPWGPPSLLYNGYRIFPGVKRRARDVDHPPPSSAEVKERVGLYPYPPLCAFVACSRVNFRHFSYIYNKIIISNNYLGLSVVTNQEITDQRRRGSARGYYFSSSRDACTSGNAVT
jgi:hypothetical protein